jgi:hypothetical protein
MNSSLKLLRSSVNRGRTLPATDREEGRDGEGQGNVVSASGLLC